MRIGVVFPTLEMADPSAVRDYAQAAEDLGYTHLTAWEQWSASRAGQGDPSTARVGWDVLTRPDSSTAGVAGEGQHGFYGAERCTIRLPGRAADRFRVRPSRVATRPRTS